MDFTHRRLSNNPLNVITKSCSSGLAVVTVTYFLNSPGNLNVLYVIISTVCSPGCNVRFPSVVLVQAQEALTFLIMISVSLEFSKSTSLTAAGPSLRMPKSI